MRKNLVRFFESEFPAGSGHKVGNYRWGVYAFYDYDGEPIYVGQTNEQLRTRIRRHLTNQRTDAVAMSVLDPFEVHTIEVWPLPQFQALSGKDSAAKAHLNALEGAVYNQALKRSKFNAVLNEKNPPTSSVTVNVPTSFSKTGVRVDFLSVCQD